MRNFLYCLMFPHPVNNHKARVLHHRALLLIISFFILSGLFFSSPINPVGHKLSAFADISVTELINLTNQKRQENGLKTLSNNVQLADAASKKASDMFTKNYWAHNSPDGTTPWVFIKGSGYDYVYAGENLARGFNAASDVVSAWMESPDHRANLLSSNFSDVGFAIKSGKLDGEETFLVVQEFGSKELNPPSPYSPQMSTTSSKEVLGFSLSPYIAIRPHFSISSEIVILTIFIFVLVLIFDIVFFHNKKIVRFAGHSLDHIIFLFGIIFVIAIFNLGAII